MKALIFPGQGSQTVGMGKDFYNKYDLVKKIFKQADDQLNYSISKIILNGPENDLQLTENTQPAILTVSYSIFKVMQKEYDFNFKTFKYFAGHSLGEYSALVCSESLNFADAIDLLHARGKAMQSAVPLGKGKMIAVLGAKIDDINNLLQSNEKTQGVCEIANDNAEGQVIVSGDVESVDAFANLLKIKKIKCIPLKVSAPFHCTLMKTASQAMEKKINDTKFSEGNFEIINNVNAEIERDVKKINQLLIDQIFSTVRWRETLIRMYKNKVDTFVEIGPGKVLTGMVKRTLKNVKNYSINTSEDIKDLINEFKK